MFLARGHFVRFRTAVSRRSASHYVADVDLGTLATNCREHLLQKLTGASNKRLAAKIFLFTRSFSNERQLRLRTISLAKDDVGSRLM
jgi:hypothetical protein